MAEKVVAINFTTTGAQNVITKMDKMSMHMSKMGTMTTRYNTQGQALSATWNKNATMADKLKKGVGGLAVQFVSLQAAVSIATRIIKGLWEWGKKSADTFRDFEHAIAEVSTILTGEGVNAIHAMSAGVEELSVRWGKSTNDLARGLYDILSAAVDASKAMDLLSIATRASIAGITSVETSVDVFTSIINSYGKTVAQASGLSDMLFQTVVRGKLVFEDLASAMGYITPIAANLGVEFEEIAAALSTVTRQGLHVDMATRGLALGLQNISTLSGEAADAAKKYGVDLSALALRVGGLEVIIKDLNDAMKTYGASILPEMIRNMRSLRVYMALAGDEGVQGFSDDLDLLNNATGRTNEALSKMASTAKTEVQIMEQTMAELERSIGDTWHGIDIWWKKAKLWWGALFSGENPGKTVKEYDDRIAELNQNFLKYYDLRARLDKIKPVGKEAVKFLEYNRLNTSELREQHDITAAMVSHWHTLYATVKGTTERMKIRDPVRGQDFANIYGDEGLRNMESYNEEYKIMKGYQRDTLTGIIDRNIDWGSVEKYLGKSKLVEDANEKMNESWRKVQDLQAKADKQPSGIWDADRLHGAPDTDIDAALKHEETVYEALVEDAKNLNTEIDQNLEGYNQLSGELDGLSEDAEIAKTNIMELTNEIKELDYKIHDTYKTMGGQEFQGTERWKIATAGTEASLDRFLKYSQMSIKYGDEFKDTYMDNIKQIEGYEEAVGSANSYLNYFNESIWEITKSDSDYNGSIKDLIKSLSEYEQAEKKASEGVEKHKTELDRLNMAVQKNNLAIMKLDLKGMKRRRGLNRTEQRKIKKIQISNMKHRISMLEIETSEEYQQDKKQVDEKSKHFQKLSDLYSEYTDRVKHSLWEMKDTRDSDIEDLVNDISLYQENYDKYNKWLKVNEQNLKNIGIAIDAITKAIDAGPASDEWEEFFGQSAALTYKDTLSDIVDFLNDIDEKSGGNNPITMADVTHTPIAAPLFTGNALGYGIQFATNQRGSYYIPKTQPYMLHKGETVSPAGSKGGMGGTVHVHLDPIHVNAVLKTNTDVRTLGSKIGQAIAAGLVDGVTSEYEVG